MMPDNYCQKIARSRVYEVAVVSPLEYAQLLSQKLDNRVLLKREDKQAIFSFKLRGAYNKISQLSPSQRKRGVIAASAGNHAQGVAFAGQKLGIETQIIMPQTTPDIKVQAVKRRGAQVIRYGDTYDQAYLHMQALAKKNGAIVVHPYDDPEVIAGQGTVGKEIDEQHPAPLAAVFVPVGGGGLIAGVSEWLQQRRPQTQIIGVEPEDSPTLHAALQAQRRVVLDNVGLFADGVAVRQIGRENFRLLREVVKEVVLLSTDEICAAMKDTFDDTRTLTEPAGALAVAGLKKYVATHQLRGQTLVAIVSGANINFDRLKHVVERYEIGANTESLLAVTIPERPGSFLEFCRAIGKRTITEFNYRYADKSQANVFVGIKFENEKQDKSEVIQSLQRKNYAVVDLSDNEVAKLHLRHMVGGTGHELSDERVYRFQFPERPGALLNFLQSMQPNWNISLFHYRNHGSAYGRVLVGIQVKEEELGELQKQFDKLSYRWQEESQNPAYKLFLE